MIDNPGEQFKKQLEEAMAHGNGPKAARFALACLGAIPGFGGAIAGIASTWSEKEQADFNRIFAAWLKLQEDEIREIGLTIFEVMSRLDQTDEEIRKRVESPEYLKLVKKCFRDWSAAESEEKRRLIRNLLSNAAATKICGDDIIAMFIQWIDMYSESHFAVIREIYKAPGMSRQDIWNVIHGVAVREDSAEADLFKLLIHDLSTGHVIRQHREKDYYGRYIKATPKRRTGPADSVMTSAFDDDKQYELTELGKWFVHYTMNEIVQRIASPDSADASQSSSNSTSQNSNTPDATSNTEPAQPIS
jgi:hypothetical protein